MMIWHPDICDCQIETTAAQKDLIQFKLRCERHAAVAFEDIKAECRAKEASREAVRVALGMPGAPDWQRGKDGGHEIILPDGLDKATLASVTAAVAVVAHPVLTKLTTLADVAAATVVEPGPASGGPIKAG